MGLLWTFMGSSGPYVIFSGAGETTGSLLILFRRTTTLGALVLGAVLTNIAALNFCYDVPVKINSSHFLAMCIFLAAPDVRRLTNLLIWQRPTEPRPWQLALPRPWLRIGAPLLKLTLLVLTGFVLVH